jgi:hypothetical protein
MAKEKENKRAFMQDYGKMNGLSNNRPAINFHASKHGLLEQCISF